MKNQYEKLIGSFPEGLMEGAEPFFFPGNAIGVLLVHGFTSHPAEMRMFGERFADRGMTVLGVRLPGHGTTPEDLARTTWMDWDEAVYRGYQALAGRCGSVWAMGSSTGGTLALHLSLNVPLAGVITLASPIYRLADWRSWFAPWAKSMIAFSPKHGHSVKDSSVTTARYGYPVNPVAAVAELLRLMRHVKGELAGVTASILAWHAEQDPVVPFMNSERMIREVGSSEKQLRRLTRSAHMLTLDFEQDDIFEGSYQFMMAYVAPRFETRD